MQFITAAHLAELLGQVTADDMQTVLRQPLVNLHGNASLALLATASSETCILLREAALRARNAIEVAEKLTDRELEVSLLLQYENAEIGAKLGISTHTVRAHVKSSLYKTGAISRVDLALQVRGFMHRLPCRGNTNAMLND